MGGAFSLSPLSPLHSSPLLVSLSGPTVVSSDSVWNPLFPLLCGCIWVVFLPQESESSKRDEALAEALRQEADAQQAELRSEAAAQAKQQQQAAAAALGAAAIAAAAAAAAQQQAQAEAEERQRAFAAGRGTGTGSALAVVVPSSGGVSSSGGGSGLVQSQRAELASTGAASGGAVTAGGVMFTMAGVIGLSAALLVRTRRTLCPTHPIPPSVFSPYHFHHSFIALKHSSIE